MTQWTSFVAVSRRVANDTSALAEDTPVPLPMVAGVSERAYPAGAGFTGSSAPEPATVLGLALVGVLVTLVVLRPRRGIANASL
jgi:hypothetical protein